MRLLCCAKSEKPNRRIDIPISTLCTWVTRLSTTAPRPPLTQGLDFPRTRHLPAGRVRRQRNSSLTTIQHDSMRRNADSSAPINLRPEVGLIWTQDSRGCSSLITSRSTDPPQHRSLHTHTASLVHHVAFHTVGERALKALRRDSQISIKYLGSFGTTSSARHIPPWLCTGFWLQYADKLS